MLGWYYRRKLKKTINKLEKLLYKIENKEVLKTYDVWKLANFYITLEKLLPKVANYYKERGKKDALQRLVNIYLGIGEILDNYVDIKDVYKLKGITGLIKAYWYSRKDKLDEIKEKIRRILPCKEEIGYIVTDAVNTFFNTIWIK